MNDRTAQLIKTLYTEREEILDIIRLLEGKSKVKVTSTQDRIRKKDETMAFLLKYGDSEKTMTRITINDPLYSRFMNYRNRGSLAYEKDFGAEYDSKFPKIR